MTKRSKITFGLLALVLAFSLILTGCPDPNNDSGSGNNNPPPKTDITQSIDAAVSAGKYLRLAVTGGDFAANAKVYFKDDGKEILVTSAPSAPDGYNGPIPRTFTDTGKLSSSVLIPVVAEAATPAAGELKKGAVKVTVKTDAYTVSGSALTAGLAVGIPNDSSGYYAVQANAAAVSGGGKIHYDSATKVVSYYPTSGNLVTTPALDAEYDAALIAVLSNLVVTDTVSFGALGAISSATFTAAPAIAKINGAFAGTDTLTLNVSATTLASFAIPANKTLIVGSSGVLGLAAAAALTVDGTLTVGSTNLVTIADAVITAGGAEAALGTGSSGAVVLGVQGSGIALRKGGTIAAAGSGALTIGATNTVTLSKATITAGGAGSAAFAEVGASTQGIITLAAGDTIALDTGTITTAGTGKLIAGKTTFDGVGVWTASAAVVTITSSANGAALSSPGSGVLTATSAPVITQAAGAGNELAIGTGVTVALGGSNAVVGTLKLACGMNPGKVSFGGTGAKISTGNTADAAISADCSLLADTDTTAKIWVSAWTTPNHVVGNKTSGNILVHIVWGDGAAWISGNTYDNGTVNIAGNISIT